MCTKVFGVRMASLRFALTSSNCLYTGIWRNYPIAVTGYSYLFGAVYMGIAVSYLFSGQAEQFLLPSHVCKPGDRGQITFFY